MAVTFEQLARRAHRSGRLRIAALTVTEIADLARARWSRVRYGVRGESRRRSGGVATTLTVAMRRIRRRPGYAVTFVATMALGTGINVAMLAVVSAAALRAPPWRDAERLVQVWTLNTATERDGPTVTPADMLAWREHTDVFEDFEGYSPAGPRVLTGLGEALQISVSQVTTGVFAQLGVQPALGRTFRADEGHPGSAPVIVLTHGLWASVFGADPDLIGRVIEVDGSAHTVVGVMYPGFDFPHGSTDAWLPVAMSPASLEATGGMQGLAHLRVGLTRETAQAMMADRLGAERTDGGTVPLVMDLLFMVTPDNMRRTLVLLQGAVGFVLLIALANVISLGIAEAARRRRELGIMATLGASRGRLLAQAMAESVILGSAGALFGLFLAWLALKGIVPLIPERLGLRTGGRPMGIWPDGVLLALAAAAVAAPVVGGLTVLLARVGSAAGLAREQRGSDRTGMRVQHGLIAGQVALSLVLLAGAGLLVSSFVRLLSVDPVVPAEHLLTVRVRLPAAEHPTPSHRALAVDAIAASLGRVPGVTSVATTTSPLPLARARFRAQLEAEHGDTHPIDGFTPFHEVREGWFETMGIAIQAGRPILESDAGQPVAIVNDVLAKRLWPGGAATGARFRVTPEDEWLTVIGISRDVPQMGPRDPWGEGMEFYVPAPVGASASWTFAVRTAGPAAAVIEPARQAIWALLPRQPIERIAPYSELLDGELARERFFTTVLGVFALLATLLAAVGIHAVVMRVVLARTAEIGLRAALGAGRIHILRAAAGPGIRAVALGVVIGVFAALGLTRFLESLLFEVRPDDPLLLAANVFVLLGVTAVAILLPAKRALGVAPVRAMTAD